MKRCSKCGEWKPKDAFSVDKSKKEGLRSNCKECSNQKQRVWARSNPEKAKAGARKRDALCRVLKAEILKFQRGECAACGRTVTVDNSYLDHDHSCPTHGGTAFSDKVLRAIVQRCECFRGILCLRCNTGLMAFIDLGLALPGPEVQYYLDSPPAQLWFALLEEWEAA